MIIGAVAFVLSGLWGSAECMSSDEDPTELCLSGDSLLIFSILVAICCFILIILNTVGILAYCCNGRALGLKSRFEILSERQMQRGDQAQLPQAQEPLVPQAQETLVPQAPPGFVYQLVPAQEQHQDGQGHYDQSQGHLIPTAPPAMNGAESEQQWVISDIHSHRKVDSELPPPSYADVMKS